MKAKKPVISSSPVLRGEVVLSAIYRKFEPSEKC
jgi:hypothetical protein